MSAPTREQGLGPLAYAPRWARGDQPPRHSCGNRVTPARPEVVPEPKASPNDNPCKPTKAFPAIDIAIGATRARIALTPEPVSEPPPPHTSTPAWPAVRQLACVAFLVASLALPLLWLSASHGESHAHDAMARTQSPPPERPTVVAATIEAKAPSATPRWSVDLMLWPAAPIARDQVGDLTTDPAAVAAATDFLHPAQAVERQPTEQRSSPYRTGTVRPKRGAPARRAERAAAILV
jgi:hypothetical protein